MHAFGGREAGVVGGPQTDVWSVLLPARQTTWAAVAEVLVVVVVAKPVPANDN